MRSRGFTLGELLVVMTISAILIAAAVPWFQWTIARNRISDATNQLLSHLEYARMESSRRGNTISICRNPTPNLPLAALVGTCSSAATATTDGNDWAAGWIVFEKVPPNVDASNFEAGDQVVFRQQAMDAAGVRVMVHTNIGTERVAFQPRGTGGMIGPGTFAITYGTAPAPVANRAFGAIALTNAGRCIPITLIGSMSIVRPGVGTCPAP